MNAKNRKTINNQKGMATLEALPLLMLFVWLIGYCLGIYGVIHTSILHSIGARAYAFETFRHRANLTYFSEYSGAVFHYSGNPNRLHGILAESVPDGDFRAYASERSLFFGRSPSSIQGDQRRGDTQYHNNGIFQLEDGFVRSTTEGVNPAWVQVQYGICLNAQCGGIR